MRIIITIKDKNKDRTNELLELASIIEKKFKGIRAGGCKCYKDGVSIFLDK